MNAWKRDYLLMVVVASIVMLTNLGGPKLWDRDEPRNASCAAEMIERNDWVTPVFNGELRTHKPVLLYWFTMAAYAVFGVNEFGARFPSAVLAIGTALATYHIGKRLFNRSVGVWSAVILCSSIMFGIAGRAATPDSVLIFFATLSLMTYVLGTFPSREESDEAKPLDTTNLFPQSTLTVVIMYGLMGIAILAKGPVGLVIPTAVIGMFLLIMRLPEADESANTTPRTWGGWLLSLVRPFAPIHFLKTCWFMRPITAVAVALAIAAPWYIWVGLRTDGEWLAGFFAEHNLGRAMRPMEGHGGGVLFYPVALLIGFFPWSVVATPMLTNIVRRIRERDPWMIGYIFAACWVGVYVGIFSIARTKLPSYVTPCYPGLALLAGTFFYHASRADVRCWSWWPRLSLSVLMVVGIGIGIGLPIAATFFIPGAEWLGFVGLIPIAGGAIALWNHERKEHARAWTTFAVSNVTLCLIVFSVVADRVSRAQEVDKLVAVAQRLDPNCELASYGGQEPTKVFYSRQTVWVLKTTDPQTKDIVPTSSPTGKPLRAKPTVDAESFLNGGPNRFAIVPENKVAELLEELDGRVVGLNEVARIPFFMRGEDLILLSTNPHVAQSAAEINRR